VSQSFEKALEEVSIIPISRPRITKDKIERDKEFHYTAVFEVIPEFEVKDYIGIELKKEKREVKEEDLALVLNQLRERGAQAKPIGEDREVRTGDCLIIDYVGVVDGKPIKDLKAKDAQVIVGDKRLMAEFEDNLIGIKKGEEKEFEITYPEDFQMKDVAGKAVNFTVTVKEILERILPELDDEFSKDLGEENLEGLRKRIRGDLEKRFNKESDDMLKGGLIKVLLERNPLDVPPSLIENEALRLKREFALNLERHGVKLPVLNDEAEGNFRNRAEQNVKASIILGAIARKEGVQVDEDEVDNKLIEISKSAAVSFQKVREMYEKNNMVDSLKASLVEDKVLNFLIEKSDAKAETQIDKEG
jgi:trigger factor